MSQQQSSDEAPLEIVDYSRLGPFEETVEKLSQFIRRAVSDWNTTTATTTSKHHQDDEDQKWFVREYFLTVPSALAGIDDFEKQLQHDTRSRSSRNAPSTPALMKRQMESAAAAATSSHDANDDDDDGASAAPGSVRLIASLHILRDESEINHTTECSPSRSSSPALSRSGHQPLRVVGSSHPISGLFGCPAFFYLRPVARVPNLGPQMTSTLLSLGNCALDEIGKEVLAGLPYSSQSICVFAPVASRDKMSFRGMSKFVSTRTGTTTTGDADSSTGDSQDADSSSSSLQRQQQETVMASCTPAVADDCSSSAFTSASSAAGLGRVAIVLPYMPTSSSMSSTSNSESRRKQEEETSPSSGPVVISTNQHSQNIDLSNRAFAGLGYLDGNVDAFVQSIGHQCRFLRAKASDIGWKSSSSTTTSSSAGKKNKRQNSSSSASPKTPQQQRAALEGTLWADSAKVYSCPVPNKKRWTQGVLASWDANPNGHDRAVAALMLGFDDGGGNNNNTGVLKWHQLAGCPSATLGTTENPLEAFQVEMNWNFLRVDATSVADNESVSWFDDVVDGLFSASLKTTTSDSSAGAGGKQQLSSSKNKNPWARNATRSNPASAAAAALGPPTSINIAARLRHTGEYGSRVATAFNTFLRDTAQVVSGPLDSMRRDEVVGRFAERALRSGKGVLNSVKGAVYDKLTGGGSSSSVDEATAAERAPLTGNNNNAASGGGGGVRSALSGWVSALWNAGTTAASAVAHSAADSVKRAHPDEFIISRRVMLASHCNNILAALRRGVVDSSAYPASIPKQQKQQQEQQFVVAKPDGATLAMLRPSDLRRQIPPGSILSRFATECRNMKHLDEVKELWVTLIDVLKEILTGAGGRNQFFEEYDSVGALQVAEEAWAMTNAHRKKQHDDQQKGRKDKKNEKEVEKDPYEGDGLTQSSSRAGVLLRALLVDFKSATASGGASADDGGGGGGEVDCVADIYHQKVQALAICADAIRCGHVAGRRSASPVMVESPLRLRKGSAEKDDKDQKEDDDEGADFEPIYAPLDRRFVAPITFGDRGALPDEATTTTNINGAAAAVASGNNNDDEVFSSPEKKTSDESTGHASRILLRDMSDFLRVNRNRRSPVSLADFLAWFSPADVKRPSADQQDDDDEETQLAEQEERDAAKLGSLPLGYRFLSHRMRAQGNAWREAWLMASKMHLALKQASSSSSSQNTTSSTDDSTTKQGNNNNVVEDDDPLQEALEIFKWLRQRPMVELFYVILKAQAAACGFQLVQHPIYQVLDHHHHLSVSSSGVVGDGSLLLTELANESMARISSSFPTWRDFCECLQSSDQEQQREEKQHEEESSSLSKEVGDDDDSASSQSPTTNRTPTTARTAGDDDEAIFDSVAPEIQYHFTALFQPLVTELSKAEYLLCTTISVCDAVSPFGSTDAGDLLALVRGLSLAVVRLIRQTDERFFFSFSRSGSSNGKNASSSSLSHESLELPCDWSSSIFTGDTTNRLTAAVPMDPSLFFRSSVCAAWMDQDRGTFEGASPDTSKRDHPPSHKTRRAVSKQYRVCGFTQKVVATGGGGASSTATATLPGTFQRLVTTVDCVSEHAKMATFTSNVV